MAISRSMSSAAAEIFFPLIREKLESHEVASIFLSNSEEIKEEMGKDTTVQSYIRLMAEVMLAGR